MDERRMARGPAWFGIGLGVVELVAPGRLARAIGLREIAAGVAMLAAAEPERRLGLRVGGDVLDAAVLAGGLRLANPGRARTLIATAAVATVVVLDVACWLRGRRASRSAA